MLDHIPWNYSHIYSSNKLPNFRLLKIKFWYFWCTLCIINDNHHRSSFPICHTFLCLSFFRTWSILWLTCKIHSIWFQLTLTFLAVLIGRSILLNVGIVSLYQYLLNTSMGLIALGFIFHYVDHSLFLSYFTTMLIYKISHFVKAIS